MGIKSYDPALCNGCGICIDNCPMDVFALDESTGKAKVAYPKDCWECLFNFCEVECPTSAIKTTPIAVRELYKPY